MLPEKFKAIIKKKKSQYTHSFFLLYLNILHAFLLFFNIFAKQLPYAFSFADFSFLSSSLVYSFSSKNEAVEINYKA